MTKEMLRDAYELYGTICQKYYNDSTIPDNVNDGTIMLALKSDMEDILTNADSVADRHAELYRLIIDSASTEDNRKNIIRILDNSLYTAEVRRNWPAAFQSVKEGHLLSPKIDYGFLRSDLETLVGLHKKNKFRKKIEDLLEDCNFHELCGLLSTKQYEEALEAAQR